MFEKYDLSSIDAVIKVFLLPLFRPPFGRPGLAKATKNKACVVLVWVMATLEPIPATYGQRARLRAHTHATLRGPGANSCYTKSIGNLEQGWGGGGGGVGGGQGVQTAGHADMLLAGLRAMKDTTLCSPAARPGVARLLCACALRCNASICWPWVRRAN